MIKQGDIHYCELPYYSDNVLTKTRPCVILSNDFANQNSYTVIVSPLTSSPKKSNLPVHIDMGGKQLRLENIFTIDKHKVKDRVKSTTWKEWREIQTGVLIEFGII